MLTGSLLLKMQMFLHTQVLILHPEDNSLWNNEYKICMKTPIHSVQPADVSLVKINTLLINAF